MTIRDTIKKKLNDFIQLPTLLYYIATYGGTFLVFRVFYKIFNLDQFIGFIHPGLLNSFNTGVLFLVGSITFLSIRLIFCQCLSISKTYFYTLLTSALLYAATPEFINSYFTQSTGTGGFLLEAIIYPFKYLFYYLHEVDLLNYSIPIVLILFISSRFISLGLDNLIFKKLS